MTLLLRNVTLPTGDQADVLLAHGRIHSVHNGRFDGGHIDVADAAVVDLTGHLLLPAPVEIHAHLDKAYTADDVANPGGDLAGAVEGWLRHRRGLSHQDITSRAAAAVERYVASGTTLIRTHVDIGTDIGLRALEAVLEVRARQAARCEIQVVAFGANPLSGVAGAGNRALLDEAVAAGADAIGACPGLDPAPDECIGAVLDLAGTRGVPVDMHIDEWLERQPCTLELLADAVLASDFGHGVVAGHCVSLGAMPPERARGIADRVAKARIAVVCLPQTNLYLQGRQHAAAPRGITAVRLLREAGVVVAAGGDNLQDPFNPLGRADPLETAALMVAAAHDTPRQAYAAVSGQARRALGRAAIGVAEGEPAELLAIRAGNVREAIAVASADRVVIHAGRIVARTSTHREWQM